ncbi:MAG: hypothetical protein IKI90_04670, partial [Treponema sp.]|nr:hypothetical protein [Treponema sp.]
APEAVPIFLTFDALTKPDKSVDASIKKSPFMEKKLYAMNMIQDSPVRTVFPSLLPLQALERVFNLHLPLHAVHE